MRIRDWSSDVCSSDLTGDTPYARALRGMRIYLHTPRLRALLALNLVAAAGGAMVFVNTIVIVRSAMGGSDQDVAWALAAFGGGSLLAALLLPGLLDRQHAIGKASCRERVCQNV